MKALTIQQPWCWAIVHGPKRVENRSWATRHRGPIALHASMRWHKGGGNSRNVQNAWAQFVATLPDGNCHHGPLRKTSLWMEFGAVIGVADVVDVCRDAEDSRFCGCDTTWAVPFQCHWRLDNVRALTKPIPARGSLGLWTLPNPVEEELLAALEGVTA